MKKAVLAYSGGLDTSVAIGWIANETGKEVVAVAARRDMLQTLLAAVRSAGLRPVGIDLSAFALIRALAGEAADSAAAPDPSPEGENLPAILYCNLGDVTNLAVARGSSCLFTRVSPFGVEVIAQRLAERRTLAMDHALASMFAPESRAFAPHITLARSDPPLRLDDPVGALAPIRFAVTEITVFRSSLRRPAPLYEPLGTYALRSADR